MSTKTGILCIGEILWDALPSALYLGGAPLNVCYHLNRFGINASIASRVGRDRLGSEAINRIRRKGIPVDQIQEDNDYETGFVCVKLSTSGDPTYNIIEPVAWDYIRLTQSLKNKAQQCWGLVFGSLAQRNDVSRHTIQQLWEFDVKKILDMNLRTPFVDKSIIYDSLSVSDIVKMNEDELNQLSDWYGFSADTPKAVEQVARKFDCRLVCVTRGADGAMLYREGEWYEHKGFPVKAKDAVGAGDAFLAALLHGIKNNKKSSELLPFANATGALVAQKDGATPAYSIQDILVELEETGRE
ncbi:carbohydrate kinase [Halalkalibaculum sp. DA384]|uniref:carbohydrate kinase family protein n=1 Tax=Halalkalibaculum sp. DA384 TaxID=3373606 RepID=UPI003753F3F6